MRACWLKWVGRDWSISADYIWLNYSDANTGWASETTSRTPAAPRERIARVSVNLFFTSFAKQARRSRKGGFTGCANVFSPIPVTA